MPQLLMLQLIRLLLLLLVLQLLSFIDACIVRAESKLSIRCSLCSTSAMQCPLERQPAATQQGQPAATQKSEDCTHCGDTHPTAFIVGYGGVCSKQLISHDVRQQPEVSLACLEGQDFPGQPAGFALMVTEARVAPVRVDAAECCPSLQTRVSKMFHNYRFNETSIVTEAAEGAGWVGAITLKYIGLLHIPTVAQVCRDANNAVKLPWQYARHQPRDGLTLRNDRCSLCGWFTSALSADDESLCCQCQNTGICSACSYVATDGRTLCGECDLEDGAPDNLRSIIEFFDSSEVHDALDYFQSCGDHSIAKMTTKRMPAMMLYILIEWRRTCVKHVMDAWNVL